MKHTPGPWKVCETDWFGMYQLKSFDFNKDITVKRPENEANAQLIEAAPDLIEAAVAMVEASGSSDPNDWFEGVDKLEKAIKKATE